MVPAPIRRPILPGLGCGELDGDVGHREGDVGRGRIIGVLDQAGDLQHRRLTR